MTKEITPKDTTMLEIGQLFPPTPDESHILIGCSRCDYSASRISRAVEDCDAQLLNLNVTALPSDISELIVALRVNHRNVEAISRSLTRYGYDVLDVRSSDTLDNDRMRSRANELLRMLEV